MSGLLLTGCASLPTNAVPLSDVDREALDFSLNNNVRLTNIGYRLVGSLPDQGQSHCTRNLPFAYGGLDPKWEAVYPLSRRHGVMVVDLLPDFSFLNLDLKRGDEILRFQGVPINSIAMLVTLLDNSCDVDWATMQFRRGEKIWDMRVPLISMPLPFFFVVTGKSAEATAELSGKNVIMVSSPLLHFVNGEDELAFVLAHEIAHSMMGHQRQLVSDEDANMANAVASGIAAGLLHKTPLSVPAFKAGVYSEKDEIAADGQAIHTMLASGYGPSSGFSFLKRVKIGIPSKARGSSYQGIHPISIDRLVILKKNLGNLGVVGTSSKSMIEAPSAAPSSASLWQRKFNADTMLGSVLNSGANPEKEGEITEMGLAEGVEGPQEDFKKGDKLVFPNTVERIFWHIRIQQKGFGSMEKFNAEWYDPSGNLYSKREFFFNFASTRAQSPLVLNLTQKESNVGRWRVRVTRGANVIDESYFFIKGEAPTKSVSSKSAVKSTSSRELKKIPESVPAVAVNQSGKSDFQNIPLGPVPGVEDNYRILKIKRVGVARSVETKDRGYQPNPIGMSDVFPVSVQRIGWFAEFTYGGQLKNAFSKNFEVEWFSPDGKLYRSESFSVENHAWYTWTSVWLDPALGSLAIGKWRVRVWKKEQLVDDRVFEITSDSSKSGA